MRKPIHLLVLIALIAVLGSFAAVSSASTSSPRLKLIKSSPVTVQGRNFKPRSRVKIVFTGAKQTTKHVTVSRSGRFTVSFKATAADRCTRWTVKAFVPGHSAVMVRGPLPMCAPSGGY